MRLITAMIKLLENSIEIQRDHLEASNVIPQHQFGFKTFQSQAVCKVLRTVGNIYSGLEEKNDFSSCFSRICTHIYLIYNYFWSYIYLVMIIFII